MDAPWITALITAYARAYHATHDSPVIFDDSLADQMYTEDEHIQFNHNLASTLARLEPDFAATNPDEVTALAWVMQMIHTPVTISRSRFAEDCLEQAIKQGVRQYVILGAGYDTFAFRRPDLLTTLEVFEIDHPVTQDMKRQRLAMPGWRIPPQLHFVPVDFNKDDLTTALRNSPYDPQQLTFFSWQGVTYYLTREIAFATLQAIASLAPSGSTIVFDYMDTDAFDPAKAAKRVQIMQNTVRQVGEPMQAGFDPLTLADDLKRCGFALQENLSPDDIQARYFQGRTDLLRAYEHIHFARATVI